MLRVVAVLIGLLVWSSALHAAESDLWLRVGWGGGAGRQWHGSIQLVGGSILEFRAVGLTPDSPGSMYVRDGELRIQQRSPHAYEVVDVRVQGKTESKILLSFAPQDAPQASRRFEFPLNKLMAMQSSLSGDLDDTKNRLLIHRVPGDDLRVEFQHPSLVFNPGEEFQFSVRPTAAGLPANATFRCEAQLISVSGRELWREDREFVVDANGNPGPLDAFRLTLPNAEGVYEIAVTLTQRRIAVPIFRAAPAASRRVQLVVMSPEPPLRTEDENWRTELEFDLANPRVLDRLKRLAPSRLMSPSLDPFGSRQSPSVERAGEKMTSLDPGAWIAIPLSIARPGELHRLEIVYPTDLGQTLGISIVEPDISGQLPSFGIDSAVDVPDGRATALAPIEVHRIPFWPKTKTPCLVISNRRGKAPAVFGKIRLQAGPRTLPPLFPNSKGHGRSLALVLDKPWFADVFGAQKGIDPEGQSALPDWTTFLDGANRLAQYALFMGYDTVVMPVWHEGCAIYPSELLESSTTYDRGVYFQTGQDPIRKDVVELLFRVFDREGIRFIPALQFNAPLPELEAALRDLPTRTSGISLIGDDGQPWHVRHGTVRGCAPYYNILHAAVQSAVRRVASEVSVRYQHHPSFVGLAIQLGPQTYSQLPDEDWGLDDETMRAFGSSTVGQAARINVNDTGSGRFAARAQLIRDTARQAWNTWRAQSISAFYRRLADDLMKHRPDARLVMCTNELFQPIGLTDGGAFLNRFTQSRLRPSLTGAGRGLSEAFLRVGMDPMEFSEPNQILFPRPLRATSFNSIWEQCSNYEISRSLEADSLFQRELGSVMIFNDAQILGLPDFDTQSPFGTAAGRLRMISHELPTSCFCRRWLVHSLAVHDAGTILHGGWMAPLGQEDAWQKFARVYRQLPAVSMPVVEPQTQGGSSKGVMVRATSHDKRLAAAVINNAPWPNRVTIDLVGSDQCRFFAVGGAYSDALQPKVSLRGSIRSMTVDLEAFDVVGLFGDQAAKIADWRASPPPSVEFELAQQINDVQNRIGGLTRMEPIASLRNPGFEESTATSIAGWETARGEGMHLAIDRQTRIEGQQSMYMGVRRPGVIAWIRGESLEVPTTGRISVEASLRTSDTSKQPPVRIAIEGQVNDRPYFRFARLGRFEDGAAPASKREKVTPISSEWGHFQFHVDDLPHSGISELRIVFELAGEGEVWIDRVAAYDKSFQKDERQELTKLSGLANRNLKGGNLIDCERFLDSYWARFLVEHVPPPTARVADRSVSRSINPQTSPQTIRESNASQHDGSTWNRFIPKVKNPFQRR